MLDKKAAEQAKRIVEGYFTKTRSKEEWDKIAVINDRVRVAFFMRLRLHL